MQRIQTPSLEPRDHVLILRGVYISRCRMFIKFHPKLLFPENHLLLVLFYSRLVSSFLSYDLFSKDLLSRQLIAHIQWNRLKVTPGGW
jgi:hypothetical protein